MAEFQPKVYRHSDGRSRRVTSVESQVKAEFDGFAATDEKIDPASVGTMAPSAPAPVAGSPESDFDGFDPAQHTVAEVNDYLAGADDAERTRVLKAESAGQNRKSIVAG